MYDILTMVLGIAGAILTALASWAAERLVRFLNKKIKSAQTERVVGQATNMVSAVVKQIHQTFVDGIKGTGEWTESAKKQALCSAVDKSKALLTCEMRSHISQISGDLDAWLESVIEAKIYDLKRQNHNK